MILDRTIFVFLLIAYVKGDLKWKLKYLHEVYVVVESFPNNQTLIGCVRQIIEGPYRCTLEVVVPAFMIANERTTTISYREQNLKDSKTSVQHVEKTADDAFVTLIAQVEGKTSIYAEQTPYIVDPTNIIRKYTGPIKVKFTDADGEDITLSTQRAHDLIYYDASENKLAVNAPARNIRLLQGASLLAQFTIRGRDQTVFIGMFVKSSEQKMFFQACGQMAFLTLGDP